MPLLTVETRPAVRNDREALAAIHGEAWRAAYTDVIPERSLNRMVERRGPAWWGDTIASGALITVCEAGETVVGYSTGGHNRSTRFPVASEIYELYLDPRKQAQGYGKALFLATCQRLHVKGRRGLVVWAIAENESARGFYEAMGGVPMAEGYETFEAKRLDKVAYLWP